VRGVNGRGALLAACGVLAVGCDARPLAPSDAQLGYLRAPDSRRAALVASLVNPGNGYSSLRLARYASGDDVDWDRLDAWNPRVALVGLDAPVTSALPADARALALPDEATWEPSTSLVALGEDAFFRYPAQLAPATTSSLSAADADRYGLWRDAARGVGGLVRAEVPDGAALALTCATCHADVVDGRLVAGVPSARFDLGLLLADAGTAAAAIDSNLRAWGPGRVDVTTNDASLPERIGDLRPVRFLSHLQYDATVRQLDVVSLAIRVETLIITAHGQQIRPPRIVALALAQYLWSLADAMPPPRDAASPGRALFEARCATCHAGDGLTSAPRPLAEIGTDPTLGRSPDRGTGSYRVPSLRGVGARPSLFHDGALSNVDALLDPSRVTDGYRGGARAAGAVKGHAFGLDLTPSDRAALTAYVRSL
jgi:cytochrome c5